MSLNPTAFISAFRPGAGQVPLYLEGRNDEKEDFVRHLDPAPILTTIFLTALSGVGKTVLLESYRPITPQRRWGWVGTGLSESASITDDALAIAC